MNRLSVLAGFNILTFVLVSSLPFNVRLDCLHGYWPCGCTEITCAPKRILPQIFFYMFVIGGTYFLWKLCLDHVYKFHRGYIRLTFTFHFHALEKEMATHSSVLAWRIPGTGEPGGLPSMGSHRVGHDWSDLAAAAADTDLNTVHKNYPKMDHRWKGKIQNYKTTRS